MTSCQYAGLYRRITAAGDHQHTARNYFAGEINGCPDRLDLNDELVRHVREHRVVFAIDIGTHAVPHLDYIRYGVAVAQPGWVSADKVINIWPLDRLRKFFAKGRR